MAASKQKLVPLEETEKEISVVNSRFIASLAPAANVEEARKYIHTVKERYATATHHVPAFLIGHGQSVIAHCTDDGEPSGTAGRPALAVLQGSGLGDAVVVVTRFYGGTKLGTGGLVRAYGDAVREVLRISRFAEVILTSQVRIIVDYTFFEMVKRLLERRHAAVLGEEFSQHVSLDVRIPDGEVQSLTNEVIDITAGKSDIQILAIGIEYRKPIQK